MPLLVFISEVLQRLKEPTLVFLEKLKDFRTFKALMDRRKYRETIGQFLSVVCPRDQELAKQAGPNNMSSLKTKREQIFEELNQMIAYTKRLEFEITRCIDTPLRIFRIFLNKLKNY